jgi:dihydroorotate dehydrogenase (NAD+) catalytic subunit
MMVIGFSNQGFKDVFLYFGPILLFTFYIPSIMSSLSSNVGGLQLRNPIMLAAGVLGSTGASLRRAAQSGAGCVVTKSIGSDEKKGHPGPTVVQVDCGLLNAMGLPNPGYKKFQDEIEIARTGGTPVVASIFGFMPEEFAKIAAGLNADAFELNLSCPHAKCYGAELGRYPERVEAVTKAVKAAVEVPVWVKLTPNTADIVELGQAAKDGGADALVAINTLKGMAIDIETAYPILGNWFGGLSGPAIKPIAVRCIYELSSLEMPVIGVGGVSCWQDVVEMMMAGACGVQVGTALLKGYGVFNEITEGLSSYLDRKNLTLNELKGKTRNCRARGNS